MEAPPSPTVPQYLGRCVSNNVVLRAPCSLVVVYVQLQGTQETIRRENSTPKDRVQRFSCSGPTTRLLKLLLGSPDRKAFAKEHAS
jgi:hypothetical protein